jgi:hypothetical protein
MICVEAVDVWKRVAKPLFGMFKRPSTVHVCHKGTVHVHSFFSKTNICFNTHSRQSLDSHSFICIHSFIPTKQHTMPKYSTTLRAALLTSGLAVQSAYAYTQVNVPSPFMYKNIDPIVFPGEHAKSHLHSFFGSDAVTVTLPTSDELRAGCTNAENPNDLSVYWVPTLLYKSGTGSLEPGRRCQSDHSRRDARRGARNMGVRRRRCEPARQERFPQQGMLCHSATASILPQL